ncbi:MAG: sulfotransferase [Bacteroidetes bacterium]|nr:sulfotransferase [Bacteroidota bacterium]
MKTYAKPLIFIGSGRSGSTVISEIIFRHEQLAWPSNYQEKFPTSTAINYLRRLFENRYWHIYGQKPQLNKVSFFNKFIFKPVEAYDFWEYITGKRIDFSRGFLIQENATKEEASFIRTFFNKMVKNQGRCRLSFKITGPSRIGYLKSIFPDALFINIVRDPYFTIQSWLKVDFWQDKGAHQLWWHGAYSDEENTWALANADQSWLLAALQYKKIQDTTREEIALHKVPCMTVAYEDFVENPERSIAAILSFAELPDSPQIEKYLKENKIYNQNRKQLSDDPDMLEQKEKIDQILSGHFSFSL